MDLSEDRYQLLQATKILEDAPVGLIEVLQQGTSQQYLNALAALALYPNHTSDVFTYHEPIFVEICGIWLDDPQYRLQSLAILAALARILPFAPHLAVYAEAISRRLPPMTIASIHDMADDEMGLLLLTTYRLLVFDNHTFASYVSPVTLQVLLSHASRYIRYLAIKIICLYLYAADAASIQMVKIYVGDEVVMGNWESIVIDYIFLSLWERKRIKELQDKLRTSRGFRITQSETQSSGLFLHIHDLAPSTASIGGILVPCIKRKSLDPSRLIVTPTVYRNLATFAGAFNTNKHLLLTGVPGSGKSSLVKDIARTLGKLLSMVTLHLNEQTDAKLLLGVYTTGSLPGSFKWRPGILTTAVKEGRWVLVEDLDRAPNEVIGTLLPLLERGELQQYNGGDTITAARGFRLIATIRTSINDRGDEVFPAHSMIGIRNWKQVSLQIPADNELSEIAIRRYPVIHAVLPRMMEAYRLMTGHTGANHTKTRGSLDFGRLHGPRDLFKWCQRTADLFNRSRFTSGSERVPDVFSNSIFLDAVSCFAGDLSSTSQRSSMIKTIAQALHVPIDRAEFCLNQRPEYSDGDDVLRIGRASLAKTKSKARKIQQRSHQPFALTSHVLRIVESVSIAVSMGEPCLLVGETGTGKTMMIQQLANALHRNLTVVNLSQQSEAGDLLGGLKPVSLRALAMPMKETFDQLFEGTFSSKRNQRFINTLGKSIAKSQWTRSLSLWQEALRMVDSVFDSENEVSENGAREHLPKRRKIDTHKYQKLRVRWSEFASSVKTFQMHIQSGSKGFAFAFVESNIVKAARNGDWILLDEINLAAPDTLESLAGLLANGIDEDASLVLAETGDAEKLYAHKDFRVFAAMNPATDIGKRDLPVGIRSRFTEIYVNAPDDNLKNLIEVVSAYINNHNRTDVQLVSDIAQLYFEIKKLAQQNRLVDSANQKPNFSLRTLTRTLFYAIDLEPLYGLRRALFEGFSMSFLTFLDKASELLLTPLIDKYILSSQKNAKALLHQTPRRPADNKPYVQFRHYWVAQGAYPVDEQPHYIITPFVERNLLNLIRATSTRRFPVLLQGPTSSGKTSMIEYLARISGNKFVRINNHEHTDLQEYLGTYISGSDGQLQYQEGVLVEALREGHWIVLDELNLAPTDVLEALNRLLDDNKELLIPETQQVVRPHPNFLLFATQNPPGMYGGRKILSRAFRNRFLELHFDDIPEAELETILRERSQIAPSFCTKIVAVYKRLSILRQAGRLFEQNNGFATLRDLFRWALRDADDREQLAINGFMLLAERVRNSEERLTVKRTIEEIMKVEINEDRIYSLTSIPDLEGLNNTSIAKRIVWTKSMRRLYVLVTEALKNNEPVLLVGETGCGKTSVCQVVSEVLRRQLSTVNAHQNTETGDLIGAQRPVRNRAAIEDQLLKDLCTGLQTKLSSNLRADQSLSSMFHVYNNLSDDERRLIPSNLRHRIMQGKTRWKALFEWSDGSLVHAMKTGHHFLLDEISLADDSVLERLNSVLEPNRTLLLAEKGSNDSLVIAVPGFQFLATMNPGGDYGKRELSPALRNRFTEIWVPQVVGVDEISEIVGAILPSPLKGFASPMVTFAAWFNTTYHHTFVSSSIRQLLAWIAFMRIDQSLDPYVALLQGAAMVFIDSLGANPAGKTSTSDEPIAQQRRVSVAKLSELVEHDVASYYNERPKLLIQDQVLTIGYFSIKRSQTAVKDSSFSLDAPTARSNAMKILRALQVQKPILLEGDPGVGKTSLITALAKVIGMPVTRINLSEQTDIMDLFGSDLPVDGAEAGKFAWRDAPFLRAMQNGEWVLLDEMNLASQSVLEGLNACLDHRGQVYISEIDQSFSKHPDFVCFAAQNPHLQGNGRKGLPASFVDRFTVVYANLYEPEDLLIIARQSFPTVEIELVAILTKCLTALNQLIRRDRKFGFQGGPWEFNLRDILRWLHLLASNHPFALTPSPTDYENLLFLQRLRNAEDVLTASRLFKENLPQVDHKHSYYRNISSSFYQVGLGLLARNRVSQPCRTLGLEKDVKNLPIMESILLCLQHNWPCLLVGPSGSGKSAIISQIARNVGADLVVVAVNSETDTMDLVGGYEQLDVQRKVVNFVRRLHERILIKIVKLLVGSYMIPVGLTDIHQCLQAEAPDLQSICDLLAGLTADPSFLDLTQFLSECKHILRQCVNENQARFEWVDGVLVKALEKGQWLVLDSANLCSSSVLDRLNSLLEPSGNLSINEHRFPDGSARIISPHPNFRLFLTMDPRHGELSRAMRNRSIELFVRSAASFEDPVLEAGSVCDSRMFRFFNFQSIIWDQLKDDNFRNVTALCFDHLAFPDYWLLRRWYAQVEIGLLGVSSPNQRLILSSFNIYTKMSTSGNKIARNVRDTFRIICNEETLQSEFGEWQTIHPLNNHSLVPYVKKAVPSVDLFTLGTVFDLMVLLMDFRHRLSSIRSSSDTMLPSEMSRLQRSMSSVRVSSFRRDSTLPLEDFFDTMLEWLEDCILDLTQSQSRSDQDLLSAIQEIMDYLGDLRDLANSKNFDEGIFQVYLGFGRSYTESNELEGHRSFKRCLACALDAFNASWKLSTGLSMERLWSTFKPPTAKCLVQLKYSLEVEQLADRFDDLKWRSTASMDDLVRIQCLMALGGEISYPEEILDEHGLQDLRQALSDVERRVDPESPSIVPYFQDIFEGLCQYRACSNTTEAREIDSALYLFAGRATREKMSSKRPQTAYGLLSYMKDLTGIGKGATALSTLNSSLLISLLQKLANVGDVSLKSFKLLLTEIRVLTETMVKISPVISDGSLDSMVGLLSRLLQCVYEAHQDILEPGSYTSCQKVLSVLAHQPGNHTVLSELPTMKMKHIRPGNEYFDQVLRQYHNNSLVQLYVASGSTFNKLAKIASAWISFFTGCLLLYVPDRPFDPALKPMVQHDRHEKRKRELLLKLNDLQFFEKNISGGNTNLRSRMVEDKLKILGDVPQISAIARPQVSELGQLQAEFNNILNTVVSRAAHVTSVPNTLGGSNATPEEIGLLRLNIAQAIKRLQAGFHAYRDITRPTIGMLYGLDTGLAMALQACAPQGKCARTIESICNLTPFAGMNVRDFRSLTLNDLTCRSIDAVDLRLTYLRTAALVHSLSTDSLQRKLSVAIEIFHNYYKDWKERLSNDQQQAAAKSSLYTYRGDQANAVDAEEEEFLEIFPDFDILPRPLDKRQGLSSDPQKHAQELAEDHRALFQCNRDPSQQLLKILRCTSNDIAAVSTSATKFNNCQVSNENLLVVLFLSLNETSTYLLNVKSSDKTYNFYSDANPIETQKLVSSVLRIKTRFGDLREIWPEHVTLSDILRTCDELLNLRHTEPLAKVITKTEQLYARVHEWQVIASKEHSAGILYDELTSLLVTWRRLELSTWAGLLDMEDKKCIEDAKSWWFIAYEAIIASPLSILNSGEDLQMHIEQLLATLGDFLLTTSMGQYAERLRLIACFEEHLSLIAEDMPLMNSVKMALVNLQDFYRRFEKSIQQTINEGRRRLEKDLKEILLLASWKDTNITALRESAKRSHHKLFKVIRKYRALLAQPADLVVKQGLAEESGPIVSADQWSGNQLTLPVDVRALLLCKSYFSTWASKPARFLDPDHTAANMDQQSSLQSTSLDIPTHVEKFANNIIDIVNTLQKETPATLTKENKSIVKHLKTRKRKAFSETLKTLRHMGFRTNLSADRLGLQASLSRVLARTPAFHKRDSRTDLDAAQVNLHKFLERMPQARAFTQNHTEDLSNGEVNRSIGYLESVLAAILQQRSEIASFESDLESLTKCVSNMRNLWVPEAFGLRTADANEEHHATEVHSATQWLPTILDVGSIVVQKHNGVDHVDSSSIERDLVRWRDEIASTIETYAELPNLPHGISSSLHYERYSKAKSALVLLQSDLERWNREAPEVGFILKQIRLWTEPVTELPEKKLNSEPTISITQIDEKLSEILDSILVVIQRVHEIIMEFPCSDDGPVWLANAERLQAKEIKALRVGVISAALNDLMSLIQFLDDGDGNQLKLASAIFASALPIVHKYTDIVRRAFYRYTRFHRSSCKMGSVLVKSFCQIASQGFCSPAEKSAIQEGKTEKLEGGTGLGEGEGAEDISKDVQDDEDLSELAQDVVKEGDKEDIEDEKDAVDMDQDELEGDMGDASDRGEDDNQGGSQNDDSESNIDEEVGSVDDFDPSAVDEKLWDHHGREAEKDKVGDQSKGKGAEDEQMATSKQQKNKSKPNMEAENAEEEDEGAQEEDEITGHERAEKMDSYPQEEQNLDLSEDINLQGEDHSISGSDADEQLDELSDERRESTEDMEGDAMDLDDERSGAEAQDLEDDKEISNAVEEQENEATGDAESPVDTDPGDDAMSQDLRRLQDYDNGIGDKDNVVPSDAHGLGEETNELFDQDQKVESGGQGSKDVEGSTADHQQAQASAESGQIGQTADQSRAACSLDDAQDNSQSQAFKKLGDALEKWYRQRREIRKASESMDSGQLNQADMNGDQELEHLPNENAEADAQALGAASEDQAHALDKRALDSEIPDRPSDFIRDNEEPKIVPEEDVRMDDADIQATNTDSHQERSSRSTFIGDSTRSRQDPYHSNFTDQENPDALNDLHKPFSTIDLQPFNAANPRSLDQARALWHNLSAFTHPLSLSLTSSLRLILAPTHATKMRGDFRTGKRLNMKRIIPYIASSYKRDKIWMRRSVPTKRNYQIMLAVDDSKSMSEWRAGDVALTTLAMVTRSLNMLEVGEVAVVGFGEDVRLMHGFETRWDDERGVDVFSQFGFQQLRTNVRKLVEESITLFREARLRATGAGAELWQLEVIISDGVCEDHEAIRRLVRQAQEEKIMIVFVIVERGGDSIVDMQQAVFEEVEGETKLSVRRYLEAFPFRYYVVVGDVRELPDVLATALRGWFREVVEGS